MTVDEEGVLSTHDRRLKGGRAQKSKRGAEGKPLMGEGEDEASERSESRSHSSRSSNSGDGRESKEGIELQSVRTTRRRGNKNGNGKAKEEDERRASPPTSGKGPSSRKTHSNSNSTGEGQTEPGVYPASAVSGGSGEYQAGPVLFPFSNSPGTPVRVMAKSLPPVTHPFAPVRVLLVDDGAINRRLVTHILRKPGVILATAVDGVDGMSKVETAQKNAGPDTPPFDVIYMDVHMPRMDGLEATRRLRAMGIDTPIVALTANAMQGDRAECLAAGMDDVLTKPFTAQDLLNSVLHYVAVGAVYSEKKQVTNSEEPGAPPPPIVPGASSTPVVEFQPAGGSVTVDIQTLSAAGMLQGTDARVERMQRSDYWKQEWARAAKGPMTSTPPMSRRFTKGRTSPSPVAQFPLRVQIATGAAAAVPVNGSQAQGASQPHTPSKERERSVSSARVSSASSSSSSASRQVLVSQPHLPQSSPLSASNPHLPQTSG